MKKIRLFLLLLMAVMLPLAMQAQCDEPLTIQSGEPFEENFDSYSASSYGATGVMPTCWDAIAAGTYGPHVYSGSYGPNGSSDNALVLTSGTSGNYGSPNYAVLPEFTNDLNGYVMTLKTKMESSSYTLTYGYITGTDTSTYQQIAVIPSSTSAQSHEIILPSIPAGTRLAFCYACTGIYFCCCIDDVVISAPAACPKPTGLAESNVTTTSATLTWDAGTASGWTLEYSTSSDFTDATSETVTGTPSINITPLTAQTLYYVRVKADCGTDGESEWCNAINFTTPCDAFVVDADHDFFEGFEGTTFAPDCWDRIAAGTYNWNRNTYSSYTHQGSGSAYSGYYGDIYLVMPELQIANGTTDVWLKFWSNNSYPDDYVKNSVVLLNGDTETELWSPESVSNSWTEAAVNLSEYKGQTIRLAFKYEGSNAHGWYLDDITVAFDPTCLKPSDVALVDGTLTAHSAKISWTDNTENPLGYILLVNDQEVDADENPFTLDLTPETQYTVRVKAVCTTEDTSDLSTDYATFTTPPTCFAPTAVSVPDSTITTTTAIVYWTDNNENDPANGWTILVNNEEVVADVNPFTLPNLTPSTAYTLKVKANCDTDDESAWSAEVHFATLCDAIVVDEEHDFTEGFEGTTFAPLCWNSIPAGTRAWSRTTSSSYVHEGSAAAYSGYYGDIYLVLPDLQIENGSTNVRLTFWSYNRFTSDYDKNSVILLDGETETELWSPETVEQSWEEVSINLSEYMGQTIRLAFKYEGSNAHAWYVDEVKVAFDPACMRPTALTVDTVTANSVTLTWVDNNEERPASWTVSYENNGTAMETISYDTTITIEELTPETAYTAKVKANCESDWSDAVNFTTLPTCPAPTNLTYSNLTATSVTLDWTVNGEETQWILVLNGQEIEVNTKPLTIDTLTEQTPYTAILRAFCAAYDTSYNSNTARFVTPCTAQTAEGYTEDFSGYTAAAYTATGSMPDCWNYISNNTYKPHVYNGSDYSPTANDNCIFMSAGSSTPSYAIMPLFDNLNGKMIRFSTAMESASNGQLTFGYLTNSTDASSFVEIETIPSNAYGSTPRLVMHEVYLPTIPEGARLTFKWALTASAYYSWYCCFDDITITDLPSCLAPRDVEATANSSTSVTISWTDLNETVPEYGWTINLNGTIDTTVTENPFTFDGLTASTAYTVKVKANCSEDDESDWSAIENFETPCDVLVVTENEPFSEDFNTLTTGIPQCWDNSEGTTTNSSYKWSYYATGATGAGLRFDSYNNSEDNTNMLKTPAMDLTALETPYLSFNCKNPTGGDFSVFVSTDGGETYTTELFTDLTGITSWTFQSIVLDNLASLDNVVIVFQGTSNYGPYGTDAYLYLDDVWVGELPTCFAPSDITVTNTSVTSLTIDWTDNNETAPQSWTIHYDNTDTTVTEHPFTIDNLNASSSYTVTVKANCTDDDESAWSAEATFETDCDAIAAAGYSEDFSSYAGTSNYSSSSVMATCWSVIYSGDESGYRPYIHNGYYAANSYDNCLLINAGTNDDDDWDWDDVRAYGNTNYAVMPPMTGLNGTTMTYKYKYENTSYGSLTVGYVTDLNASSFQSLHDVAASSSATMDTITFTNVPEGARIAFRWTNDYSYYAVAIDDINITGEPVVDSCETPTNVAYENGVVTWTGDAANYNVHIVAGETVIDTTVSTATYTIEGLNEGDHATVTVQAVCDEDNLSDWSEAVEFDYIIDGINSYAIQANIFPNPTTGNVTVESNAINADITVFDMFGKLMMTSKVAAERTELNFSSFAPGVYMVRIANSNAITTIKVVKE